MATIPGIRQHVTLPAGLGAKLPGWCFGSLVEWNRRWRERAQLRALDDHALADLGLTRGDILREVDKHFWQR
jgi:uncharacterized protein YjiS (DUF1127 family)